MEEKYFDYEEASVFLKICIGTLYALVSRRQIPHVRFSGRIVRFSEKDLTEWRNAHRIAPDQHSDAKMKKRGA
jgi:excisionase family DNA binding protein